MAYYDIPSLLEQGSRADVPITVGFGARVKDGLPTVQGRVTHWPRLCKANGPLPLASSTILCSAGNTAYSMCVCNTSVHHSDSVTTGLACAEPTVRFPLRNTAYSMCVCNTSVHHSDSVTTGLACAEPTVRFPLRNTAYSMCVCIKSVHNSDSVMYRPRRFHLRHLQYCAQLRTLCAECAFMIYLFTTVTPSCTGLAASTCVIYSRYCAQLRTLCAECAFMIYLFTTVTPSRQASSLQSQLSASPCVIYNTVHSSKPCMQHVRM
ncbi:hypothetical protein J6590_013116 [Homalodisca vitripennis]|nr:hypothetical protein J6590_013116 [Homalodisca vitripennis]